MPSEEINETAENTEYSGAFELDPELFDGIDFSAISEDDGAESSEEGQKGESGSDETPASEENETSKSGEQDKEEPKSDKLTAAQIKDMSWEELSAQKDKIPDEFMETFKSMDRQVQIKFKALSDERKETQKVQERLERLERQMQEEPPYLKEERERRRQKEERERRENMTPEEIREEELEQERTSLKTELLDTRKLLEQERFYRLQMQVLGDIKDELLSEGLPVKDAKVVYDIWSKKAYQDQDYTLAQAVEAYKSEKESKPKTMTEAEIKAKVDKLVKEKIDALKAKAKGANGIKSSTPASTKTGQQQKERKIESAEDIFQVDEILSQLPDTLE